MDTDSGGRYSRISAAHANLKFRMVIKLSSAKATVLAGFTVLVA